jgi:hypothetical protein
MKLTKLAKAPELIKLELNDEEIIKEYGEPLEFWIWDRTPMDTFIKMATMKPEDFGSMVNTVNTMVLDEDGAPVVKDGLQLPTPILTKVIAKVVENLGK